MSENEDSNDQNQESPIGSPKKNIFNYSSSSLGDYSGSEGEMLSDRSLNDSDLAFLDDPQSGEESEQEKVTTRKVTSHHSGPTGLFYEEWKDYTKPSFRPLPLEMLIVFLSSVEARRQMRDTLSDGKKKGKR